MAGDDSGNTRNTIGGGTQYGPVLQGRDFRDVSIVTYQAAAAPVALAQLPALVPGFTGRERELAAMIELLDPAGTAEPVVVSAVAGLAGVGKTTLAVQAAHAAHEAGWFPGGLLFLDLHGYDDTRVEPGQALDALLRALGVPAEHIPPGAEARAGLYRSKLAQLNNAVLIIADNASSEAQVRLLLPGPGPHRVIVTSRHTLAALGARLLDVSVLNDQTGVALMDAALRAARPDDDRISRDGEAAARLAGICGGLPLALSITAALLSADPLLMVSELAEELADQTQRLEALRYDDGGGTSAPSVAAAFELSYRQLDETAARVFRLLPVNPGPDLSSAAAAALAGDLLARDLRMALGGLVRAHLIEAAAGAAGRWRMHDLLRLYARQLSDAHADADAREQARDRLLCYYMETANAADQVLRGLSDADVPADWTGRASARAWLDAERPSLVAAVVMADSTGRDQIAMRLPFMLDDYLVRRRRFDDLMAIATVSRNAARRLADREKEAGALTDLGVALSSMRRFEEAIIAYEDAVVIDRETGDRHGEGSRLNNLGVALTKLGRFEEAITALQDAAAICRETGDRLREGRALANLGDTLTRLGRFEEAITACQEAVAIDRAIGDRHGEGAALNNLGRTLAGVGRFEEAITIGQEAVASFKETGDRHGEGDALSGLGRALAGVGRVEEAITVVQEAVESFRETADRHGEGAALSGLGLALAQAERLEEAITACLEAVAIFRETGDRHGEGDALTNLGRAQWGASRFEEAVTACLEAVAIFRETGDQQGEAMALTGLGASLRGAGRLEEAITAHQDAATIFRESGNRHDEAMALKNLELDQAAQGA